MRGQTAKFYLMNQKIRRSTKHFKVGRTAYPITKKWDILLTLALDTPNNLKKVEGIK